MSELPIAQRLDPRPRALVIDAEPSSVGTIAHALGEAGIEVVTAYRAASGLARLVDEPPDIVIVGARIDDEDPVALIARLRARAAAPILAIASWADEAAFAAILDSGADDAIDAAFRPLELVARVRALLRRAATGAVAPSLDPLPDGLRVDIGRREASVHDQALRLTPIELELLSVIGARRGDVVDHRTLLRAAWPGRADVDPDLLRTHLTHLNAKLVAVGHPGLRNVRSTGYALRIAGGIREA